MRLLAFSDLHVDTDQAGRLVDASEDADVVLGVGDFASVHSGLDQTIAVLRRITKPAVLVPGNNETEDALRAACDVWEGVV
jgi:predicted phosphodiesterase